MTSSGFRFQCRTLRILRFLTSEMDATLIRQMFVAQFRREKRIMPFRIIITAAGSAMPMSAILRCNANINNI